MFIGTSLYLFATFSMLSVNINDKLCNRSACGMFIITLANVIVFNFNFISILCILVKCSCTFISICIVKWQLGTWQWRIPELSYWRAASYVWKGNFCFGISFHNHNIGIGHLSICKWALVFLALFYQFYLLHLCLLYCSIWWCQFDSWLLHWLILYVKLRCSLIESHSLKTVDYHYYYFL